MTPSCRAEIHDPARRDGPAPGHVRIVLSRKLPPRKGEPPAFVDEDFHDYQLDDMPGCVVMLLKRRELNLARVFIDAWFVSHAQAAGLANIVLGGGP